MPHSTRCNTPCGHPQGKKAEFLPAPFAKSVKSRPCTPECISFQWRHRPCVRPSTALCSRFGTLATVLQHTGVRCSVAAMRWTARATGVVFCVTSRGRRGTTRPGARSRAATCSMLRCARQADGRPATTFCVIFVRGARVGCMRNDCGSCSTGHRYCRSILCEHVCLDHQ